MKKSKVRNIILALIFIFVVCVGGFYYYIAIGFGKSASKVIEGVYKANKEWEKKGVSPIDTIVKDINRIIDTTEIDTTQKINAKINKN